MEHKYVATVIIPVYNAEKTLHSTLKSLFDQTIDQQDMEILLVNDGSTDASGALCEKYALEKENVFVINQLNGGVSAARNNGIKNAHGKYLFFLDSDDRLDPGTVKNVTCFFEKHYEEIDLVTYPLNYIYENGKTTTHWRYKKILREENVYALDREPNYFISQTTMNICVKKELEALFDESIKYGEDQLFITSILVRHNAIGYVPKAGYMYFRPLAPSPYGLLMNCLPDVKYMFDTLVALKNEYPESKKYIDALLVYNCEWRIKGDYFYPYHLAEPEFKRAIDEIRDIFDGIDGNIISRHPNCDFAYKYFMLSLKRSDRPKLIWKKNSVSVVGKQDGKVLFNRPQIDIIINQLKIRNDQIYILGYVKGLETQLSDVKPTLTVVVNNDIEKNKNIELFYSQWSCYGTEMPTNSFNAFIYKNKLESLQSLRFEVSFGQSRFKTKIWYNKRTTIDLAFGRNFLVSEKYGLLCSTSEIKVANKESQNLKKAVTVFEKSIKKKSLIQWLKRKLLKVYSRNAKNVWLYTDSHDAIDNGYFQFVHDSAINDGIARYYIYHADRKELIPKDALNRFGNHLVPFGSKKHKLLLIQASKILAAYVGRGSTIPFTVEKEQLYRDLLNFEVIYLQHGVMNAKLPNMYSKEKVYNIDKIIVSTNFERENLLKLAYEEDDILTCGMPRLDFLRGEKSNQRKGRILFAPSWRKRLVATINRVQTPLEAFYNSIFFKSYYAFLHNQAVEEFLEQNNLYLDVQMHPMFSCYNNSFGIGKLSRIQEVHFSNPSDYDCCITDFSSILFDYIYLNKPVISYFPDKDEFKGGTHTYREFSFPIDGGFMLVCNSVADIIQGITNLYNNQMKLPDIIQKKADTLFLNRGNGHRDAIYDALKEH